MPRLFTPQIPMPARRVPEGDEWVHEIKHDGYRAFARIENGRVELITRSGANWARALTVLVPALRMISADCIIDGEVAAPDEWGVTSVGEFREIVASQPERLVYYGFDLLWLDGEDCRQRPLIERKGRLETLIRPAVEIGKALFVEHVEGAHGTALCSYAMDLGCEGIISKRAGSLYRGGQNRDWLKIKPPGVRKR